MSYFTKFFTGMFQSTIASSSITPSAPTADSQTLLPPTQLTPTTPPRNNRRVSYGDSDMPEQLSSSHNIDALDFSDSPTGSQRNPIKLVDYPDSDMSSEADIIPLGKRIPPPPTCDSDGTRLLWRSEDLAFEALQLYAKENGFAVRKADKRVNKAGILSRYVNCVCGGLKHNTKVLTPQRKR